MQTLNKVKPTLQLLLTKGILVLVKVKETLRNRGRRRLVIWVMVRLQIRMTEGIFDRNSLGGVECEESLEKIKGEVVALGEEDLEGDLLLEGKGTDVLSSTSGFDSIVVLHSRCAQDIQDKSQLMVV